MRIFILCCLILSGCSTSLVNYGDTKILGVVNGGKDIWIVRDVEASIENKVAGTKAVNHYQVVFYCRATNDHPICFAAKQIIPSDGNPYWPRGAKCPSTQTCLP